MNNATVFVMTVEALHGMEAVAEHINEMQKIYEEYGSVFDELSKQYKDAYPQTQVDLPLGYMWSLDSVWHHSSLLFSILASCNLLHQSSTSTVRNT